MPLADRLFQSTEFCLDESVYRVLSKLSSVPGRWEGEFVQVGMLSSSGSIVGMLEFSSVGGS